MTEDDDNNKRIGRLIDAATEHVKTHGLTPATKTVNRTGRVQKMGRNIIPIRPSLPGLPQAAKKKGSFISMSMNDSRTRVKVIISIDGVESWIIMNRSQLARFMAGCGDTIRQMVEEPKQS
jgi:hypothetical protein